jgi:hypothetical protein
MRTVRAPPNRNGVATQIEASSAANWLEIVRFSRGMASSTGSRRQSTVVSITNSSWRVRALACRLLPAVEHMARGRCRIATVAVACFLFSTGACGSSTPPTSPSPAPAPAPAPTPGPSPAPAPAPAPAPPPQPIVTIAPGEHRVGTAVQAGRYYADPSAGCYWERRSSNGSVIGFAVINFDAGQWIVDILPSDNIFETRPPCGTWFNTARHPLQEKILPGMWVVGDQVAPGLYQTSAAPGCYWERLRHFRSEPDGIIASDLIGSTSLQFVTINGSDAGFRSDAACGTWSRAGSDAPR